MIFEKGAKEQNIKDAFERVKQDIFTLGKEISGIRIVLSELKTQLNSINEQIEGLKISNFLPFTKQEIPTHIPTDNLKNPTNSNTPTHIPTDAVEIGGLKYPNFDISTRNRGVPTDRQTNQQTDEKASYYEENPKKPLNQQIQDASDILNSLDSLKKEIRLKFKQITQQEMLVFSTIYQLEESYPEGVEYRQIAQKIRLSESSIRDYTQKLIIKGIPLDKIKLNNKKILLKISQKLKSLATLDTLIKLREL